jgi:hypothetical protein
MNIVTKLPAFACGMGTTLVAFALFVDVNAQPVARKIVDVCADAKGTLRLTEPTEPCEPGARRLRLRQPDIEEEKEETEQQQARRVRELDQRLKDLEDRNNRGRLLGSKVVAPFEVVNDAGKRIFYVDQGSAVLYNADGTGVARIVANEHGGYLETRSTTADLQAVIGASGQRVNVLIVEKSRNRIDLGRNDEGAYRLGVYEPGGKIVAGIGQGTVGSGVVMVADTGGSKRAAMYVHDTGGGIVEMVNRAGTGVAKLFASEQGNGRLELTNETGTVMVEAGVTDGVGVVRAGPAGFHPGVGILGLPGSFIHGKPAQ